jgi:VWFA-related protein
MLRSGWIVSLLLAGLCYAADDPSVFRVNTQLVEVDIVVNGKHGPVAGLTKNDFTILDNGKPQQISLFSVQSHLATRNAAKAAAPLAPGVVSNRLTRTGEDPASPTVVLWDALNTEVADQAWVRSQVIKYLQTMNPRDPIAVYILVKNLRVIQDFTDDAIPLIQAVRHTNAEQSADLSAPDLTDLQAQTGLALMTAGGSADPQNGMLMLLRSKAIDAGGEMSDYALRDQVYLTQAALEAIAEHLSGLPGRKKLVWISGSFPTVPPTQRDNLGLSTNEYLDFSPQIDHAIRALNGANVAVYPIDPRGVATGAVSASTRPTQLAPGGAVPAEALTAGALAAGSLTAPGIDTMNMLAGGTGGEAFYATNDATGAIKTIMDDGQVTYRLGFYPSELKLDGAYHSISVKVAHRGSSVAGNPIEAVRARKGYFALDAKNSTDGHWRERLNESMQNPLEATQLGLRASAVPVKGTPGMYELELTLDLEGLHLEHQKNLWVGTIAYSTLVTPSESTKGTLETIRLSLTEDRLRAGLKDGYVLRRKVVVGDSKANLRVAIEDTATGVVGSVTVPFEQPKVEPPAYQPFTLAPVQIVNPY